MSSEQRPDLPISSVLKEIHSDIDGQYRAKNRRKRYDTDAIEPYCEGTVIRLKEIHRLVALVHPDEFLQVATGLELEPADISTDEHDCTGEDNVKGEKSGEGKKKHTSIRRINLASYLIEKYLELEPDEFEQKVGLENTTTTDEKKILKQAAWLLDFYDFFYTYFYPSMPYYNTSNYEELIQRVTRYDWNRTAKEAYQQYVDLKKVWAEIKKKIFTFKQAQGLDPYSRTTGTDNVEHSNTIERNHNYYKKMADMSQINECTIPAIQINSPTRLNLSLSLNADSNKISFTNHSRSDVDYLLDLIGGIPIDNFAICAYDNCGRCIVITDKRKKCCNKEFRACSSAWSRLKKQRAEGCCEE